MILEWKLPKDFIQYLLGFQIKPNCTNKKRERKKAPLKVPRVCSCSFIKIDFSQVTQIELQLRKIKPLILKNNLHLEKNST